MKVTSHFKKVTELDVPDIEITYTYKYVKYLNFVNDKWSPRDIELMIIGYNKVKGGKLTVKEVAKQIGKSYSSLKNKAWRMGISHGYRD
jgi:hypothetical protein